VSAEDMLLYLRRLPVPPVTSVNTTRPIFAPRGEYATDISLAVANFMQRALSVAPSSYSVLVDGSPPSWGLSADTNRAIQQWFGHSAATNARVPLFKYEANWLGYMAWDAPCQWPPAAAGTFFAPPSAAAAQIQQEALVNAVRRIFPSATLSLTSQADPEEGWTRPLLRVESGVGDLDKLDDLEHKFYEEVEKHETLISALNSITVLFV